MKGKVKAIVLGVVLVCIVLGCVFGVVFFMHGRNSGAEPLESSSMEEPVETTTGTEETSQAVEQPTMPEPSGNVVEDTFAEDIRELCVLAFGEYQEALQDACVLVKDAGYDYFTAFTTDTDTYVVEEDYLEFTAYLPGARGRFVISKRSGSYETTFRLLADDELLSPSLNAPDGLDSIEEGSSMRTKWEYDWSMSGQQVDYAGWYQLDSYDAPFYTFDSDFMTEVVGTTVMNPVREMFETDSAAYDMVSFVLARGTEDDLKNITVERESSSSLLCYWSNFMFRIWWTGESICTDIYTK